MTKSGGFVFISMLLAVWTSAKAADIKVTIGKELTVVSVEGELNFQDEDVFTDKVLRLKESVVVFDSIGGNLIAGFETRFAGGAVGVEIAHDDLLVFVD